MWRKFDKCIQEMFRFTNGKQVVLWGYGEAGWFIEHIFRVYNKKIDNACGGITQMAGNTY